MILFYSIKLRSQTKICRNQMTMEEDKDIYTQDGTLDIHKTPANKSKTGTWKACRFILGIVQTF